MGGILQPFKFFKYYVWSYDEFAHFLIHLWKKFLSLVWKGGRSGSLWPNNYGSGRIQIQNTESNHEKDVNLFKIS